MSTQGVSTQAHEKRDFLRGRAALGLLLLRVIGGLALFVYGTLKLHAPFSWLGESSDVPGFLQATMMLGELAGGLALMWVF